jgi:tetratricopeptide (TPR) repeat protein
MNVALAILALPTIQASDQVRLGVAVQSLRAALRVYTEETHPEQWSSGRLNLANALQYLPSGHREDNLAEAVDIYEELLAVRSPQRDPAGYARVLANQGNALAHLGILDHAQEKFEEAMLWFSRLGEGDAVAVLQEQVARVAEARDAAAGLGRHVDGTELRGES